MIIRKLEALFTINTNAVQFQKAASELDKLANKAEGVMKAIAGYWAVQALQNFVANTANAMAEIGKTAEYLGIGADALGELRYAAEKSGVSIDALNDALKELQVRAFDAKSGQGEAGEAFNVLGLKSTDASGRIRGTLELLDAVADSMKALPTQSDRIWVADAIFGDEGSMVLKMLKDGSAGLRDMRKEAQLLGLVMDPEGARKIMRYDQSLKGVKSSLQVMANTVVQGLLRPLSWLMEVVTSVAGAFNRLENRAALVRIGLLSLSGILTALAIKGAIVLVTFLAPFAPLILGISLAVAGIVALAVVIEDLYTAFKGGDSVFGSLWRLIVRFVKEAGPAISKGLGEAFDSAKKEFFVFSKWLSGKLDRLVKNGKELLGNLVPDFMKKGSFATLTMKGGLDAQHGFQQLNTRFSPSPTSIANQNRLSQNVNVSVNVKSGANPQEIGGDVSKAVRKELERERFNAFMGVSQYAG